MSGNVYSFQIIASPDPQALPRIVGYFAQLGVIPSEMVSRRTSDGLDISIEQSGILESQAHRIAGKLHSCFLVNTVSMVCGGSAEEERWP